jgi:hypothetical protein
VVRPPAVFSFFSLLTSATTSLPSSLPPPSQAPAALAGVSVPKTAEEAIAALKAKGMGVYAPPRPAGRPTAAQARAALAAAKAAEAAGAAGPAIAAAAPIPRGPPPTTREGAVSAIEAQLRARLAAMQAGAATALDAAAIADRCVAFGNLAPAVDAAALGALLESTMAAAFPGAVADGSPAVRRIYMEPARKLAVVEFAEPDMAAAGVALSGQVDLLGSTLTAWPPPPPSLPPSAAVAASAAGTAALDLFAAGDLEGARDELEAAGVHLPGWDNPLLGMRARGGSGGGGGGGGGGSAPTTTATTTTGPPKKPTPALRVDGLLPDAVLADADALTAVLTGVAAECAKYGEVLRVATGDAPVAGTPPSVPIFVVFAKAASSAVARMTLAGKSFGGGGHPARPAFCADEDVPPE